MIIFESDEEFVDDFNKMSEEEKLSLIQDLKGLAGCENGPLLFYGPCERLRVQFMSLWNCTPVDVFGESANPPKPTLERRQAPSEGRTQAAKRRSALISAFFLPSPPLSSHPLHPSIPPYLPSPLRSLQAAPEDLRAAILAREIILRMKR
ncbi:MAG: hypothetical protein RXR41_02770 [Candidatus Marsarchaeota archaeon]